MRRSPNLLVVRPLFYDGLSGEFRPACDLEQRTHTLGRLARAAYLKGEITYEETDHATVSYVPSWAGSVTATASISREQGMDRIFGVRLHVPGEVRAPFLDISDAPLMTGDRQLMQVYDGRSELFIDLADDINAAQAMVAERAQAFFDQINA